MKHVMAHLPFWNFLRHLDSVDYVLVIILSDVRDMDGGRLEVVMRPTDQALELLELRKGKFLPRRNLCPQLP